MFKNLLKIMSEHRIVAGLIIIILVIGGYFGYKNLKGNIQEVRYVLATVQKGTLITSISGSGQVSASNQVDIKPKASGNITYLGIAAGQEVKTGAVLMQIDSQDAQKAVRDAQTSLETAQLSLEKLKQPADEFSVLQAENALEQAQESKQKAEDDLKKDYEDGFNDVANTFLDLPSIMSGLNDTLFGSTFKTNQQNIDYYTDVARIYDEKANQYRDDVYTSYQTARLAYNKNYSDYKSASRFSDTSTIESLINESYETTKNIAETIKNASNLIQFYEDKLIEHSSKPQTLADTHLSSLGAYTGKTNSQISSLLSAQQAIANGKKAIADAEWTIIEKTESLKDLQAGPDSLDLRSQELAVEQKQNALADAQEKLADYVIRAPFDGIITKVDVKKGDSASAGTAIATLITKQRIAEISLNEVDVAKVKVGQKVTLTFDAIEDLSITGEVAEIDTLGTVTQGVVNYNVKIGFDTQDERVKPGMSVSAAIITDIKQDVLLVPNAAVKSNGNGQYVEILVNDLSQSQSVETGLSNDTLTEITNGLKEGDKVVTQTITGNTTNTTQTSSQSRNEGGFMMMGR